MSWKKRFDKKFVEECEDGCEGCQFKGAPSEAKHFIEQEIRKAEERGAIRAYDGLSKMMKDLKSLKDK